MPKIPYVRLIRQFAEETPHRKVIVCDDDNITCEALDKRSNRLARAYAAQGVVEGDVVTICLPNGMEYFFACVAIWKLGAIPNPLSVGLPAAEFAAILAEARPSLIVGISHFSGYKTLPAQFKPDESFSDESLPEKVSPYERAMTSGGSTGRPKLIIPANPALYDQDNPPQLFTPEKIILVPGPLYHAGAYSTAWGGVFSGGCAVVMTRFDPEQCLKLIEQYRIDRVFFVPTMLNRIWRLPARVRQSYDLSSLKFVASGGAPCPQWLFRAWIDWLGPDRMFEGYGPSERIGRTFITGTEWLQHPGSVGKAMDGCKIRILDEQMLDVPVGSVGEIYMMPATGTASTFIYRGADRRVTADGWESVGDMGYLDAEGYLYIADRRTDMILCGGRNIFPAEIEAALNSHPAVKASVVIGLPDDDMGQKIHAIVEYSNPVTEEELRPHLENLLIRYKIPHSFEFVQFPLFNEAGKVRRSELRAERIYQTQ